MTPAVSWCTQKCLFCWRSTENTLGTGLTEYDEPSDIIDATIECQRNLLAGFGGIPERINKKKYMEARDPNQAAISLSGEPTIYPLINGLIEEFDRRNFTTFLVTNGTIPGRLAGLDTLPTQLYLSLDAPDEKVYKTLCNPVGPECWGKLNETIDLFPSLDTRKVIRITLVKGYNMHSCEKYAELIESANPDFIEIKAYMYVGGSRRRLTLDNMPSFPEVEKFANDLSNATGYQVKDHKRDSRVILLSRDGRSSRIAGL